jgi:hypothetical protein
MTKRLRLVLLCGLLFVPCHAFARGQAKIRIGKVTLRAGMPQDEALRSLRRSPDLSVIEDHANVYLIKRTKLGVVLGTVEFKDSKLISASKNWGRPRSDQLASAPFANAVFDALDDLTGHGQSACIVATYELHPTPEALKPSARHSVTVFDPSDRSQTRGASITCGKATADIGVGTAYFGDTSSVALRLNYQGPLISTQGPLFRNANLDGYKGPIRVGNVTVFVGMPQEEALQLLRSSHNISGTKVPQAPNLGELYFITDVESPALLWSVLFEGSKIWNASKYWILPGSDKLTSALFANAVFDSLDNRPNSACAVQTAATNPNLQESPTGSTSRIDPNDGLSVIKHVYVSCGEKQVNLSIGMTSAGNYSSVDIAESLFAK